MFPWIISAAASRPFTHWLDNIKTYQQLQKTVGFNSAMKTLINTKRLNSGWKTATVVDAGKKGLQLGIMDILNKKLTPFLAKDPLAPEHTEQLKIKTFSACSMASVTAVVTAIPYAKQVLEQRGMPGTLRSIAYRVLSPPALGIGSTYYLSIYLPFNIGTQLLDHHKPGETSLNLLLHPLITSDTKKEECKKGLYKFALGAFMGFATNPINMYYKHSLSDAIRQPMASFFWERFKNGTLFAGGFANTIRFSLVVPIILTCQKHLSND